MARVWGSHLAIFVILLTFSLTVAVPPVCPAQDSASMIYGSWTIKKIIPTSNGQTSAEAAKKYLKTEIEYSRDKLKFGSETVEHPTYKTGKLARDVFYEQYRLQLKELGITGVAVSTIEVLDAKGEPVPGPGAIIFVKNSNVIITMWDGIYFEMMRRAKMIPISSS